MPESGRGTPYDGEAPASALAARGWEPVVNARGERPLHRVVEHLGWAVRTAVAGDVADPAHRKALADGWRMRSPTGAAGALGAQREHPRADADAAV